MQNNQVKKDVDVYRNVPDWLCTYSTWNNVVNHTDVIRTTGLQFTGHLSHRGRRQRASPLRYIYIYIIYIYILSTYIYIYIIYIYIYRGCVHDSVSTSVFLQRLCGCLQVLLKVGIGDPPRYLDVFFVDDVASFSEIECCWPYLM